MPRDRKLETVVEGVKFCESPRWHDGAFWFSDIGDNKIWQLAGDGSQELVTDAITGPSGLGWTESGDLLVAALLDSTIYRVGKDGKAHPFCTPEQHGTGGTNDMATIGARSYVTCAGHTHTADNPTEDLSAPVGSVIMIDHDTGAVRTVASGYAMPNGIAFMPGGKQLVFSELFASRLLVFDVDPDGSLSNEQVFAELDGCADGICIDAQGGVWAATTSVDRSNSRFERIDTDGNVVDSIPTPEWTCIAPALGGNDGRDLLMVTNHIETPDDVFNGKARSRLYKTRVDVPAAPEQGLRPGLG